MVNGEEKPPELFSIVGDTPAGGVTISELSKTVTVVTSVTSTKPVLVTTAAAMATQTVTTPQIVYTPPGSTGVPVTRPAVSGVIPTTSVSQSTDRIQPVGGGDMNGLSGIAQILAMMQASQQQATAQAAERERRG